MRLNEIVDEVWTIVVPDLPDLEPMMALTIISQKNQFAELPVGRISDADVPDLVGLWQGGLLRDCDDCRKAQQQRQTKASFSHNAIFCD